LPNILRGYQIKAMPKVIKTKKKVSKTKTKEIKQTSKKTVKSAVKVKEVAKGPIKISANYVPKDTEKYMCDKHKVYFRMKLQEWRKELVKANNDAFITAVWMIIASLQI
jgi:DnaK suppressor protein